MVKDANFLILGITFKENCPDIRNTKVVDIYHTLREYSSNITIYDPWANKEKVLREYNIEIKNNIDESTKFDAIILAVAHNEFKQMEIKSLLNENGIIYDVKGVLDRNIIDGRL